MPHVAMAGWHAYEKDGGFLWAFLILWAEPAFLLTRDPVQPVKRSEFLKKKKEVRTPRRHCAEATPAPSGARSPGTEAGTSRPRGRGRTSEASAPARSQSLGQHRRRPPRCRRFRTDANAACCSSRQHPSDIPGCCAARRLLGSMVTLQHCGAAHRLPGAGGRKRRAPRPWVSLTYGNRIVTNGDSYQSFVSIQA